MTLWSSYTSLRPQTRALLGLGLMANATLALHFSDNIEAALGLQPTAKEREAVMPRVRLVERGGGDGKGA